jgi:nucleoside-diphosphate-sugar epimerase
MIMETRKIIIIGATGFVGSHLTRYFAGQNNEVHLLLRSSSEYGFKRQPMGETDVCESGEDYGVSKTAASLYCQMAARRDRKPIITLLLFSPYESYDDATRLIPMTIISCLNGRPPRVSSPVFVRDYIYIRDIVSAYEKAVETSHRQTPGEIFNIGSGKQQTVGDLVQYIVQLVDKNIQPEWGNPSKRQTEPSVWQADVSKAESSLGWKPRYLIEQGLGETVERFRKNVGLYEGKRLL